MKRLFPSIVPTVAVAAVLALPCAPSGMAQFGPPARPLGEGPWIYDTFERDMPTVRVSVVTKGLSHPWAMAFLPEGGMLITERAGDLRIVRDGVLDPEPVPGLPDLDIDRFFDIALHPEFETNGLVYFTYIKSGERPDGSEGYWATTALARDASTANGSAALRIFSSPMRRGRPWVGATVRAWCSHPMARSIWHPLTEGIPRRRRTPKA